MMSSVDCRTIRLGHPMTTAADTPSTGLIKGATSIAPITTAVESAMMLDGEFWAAFGDPDGPKRIQAGELRPDWDKRGFLRGYTDERYTFGRYFSPLNPNRPRDLIGTNCVITTSEVTETFGHAQHEAQGAPLLLNVRTTAGPLAKGDLAVIVAFDPHQRVYFVEKSDQEVEK